MTQLILDIAQWQTTLSLADAQAAGFTGVNLKVSHGIGTKSVHPYVGAYATEASRRGMAIGTFHWLDRSATGTAQANWAYGQMAKHGLTAGTAHTVDCESDATLQILRDYLVQMQGLMRRPIAVYTGDWWWPVGWNVSDLTGYLWAAPNSGYLEKYPGDTSEHWRAGYGGWPELSVMQFAVGPLIFPDGRLGTINVSKSAIRDDAVWTALTTDRETAVAILVPALVSLRAEFNAIGPNRDKASDGWIGDKAHALSSSDHNPDETGVTPYEDADFVDEVHGLDVDMTGPWPTGFSMESAVQEIIRRHKAGVDDRLQNIIYRKRIWSRSWGWTHQPYTGSNAHDQHAHFSCRYTSAQEADTSPWGLNDLLEADVSQADVIAALKSAEGRAALYAALNQDVIQRYDPATNLALPEDPADPAGDEMTWATAITTAARYAEASHLLIRTALAPALQTLVNRPDVNPQELATALASPLAVALAPLLPPDKEVSADVLRDAFRDLLAGGE